MSKAEYVVKKEHTDDLVNLCSELASLAAVMRGTACDLSGYESHLMWTFCSHIERITEDLGKITKEFEL